MLRRLRAAAIVVQANERNVEAVTRKHEIVGVAAKRSDVQLWCKHEPHVVVTAKLVELELPTVIQRDDFAAGPRRGPASLSLDLGDDLGTTRAIGGSHPLRDVNGR